jgi:competence protein ComEC
LLIAGAAVVTGAAAAVVVPGRTASVFVAGALLLTGVLVGGVRFGWNPASAGTVAILPTEMPLRLTGVLTDDPTPRGVDQDIVLEAVVLHDAGAGPRTGRLQVRVPRAAAVRAGDEVALEVTIQSADPTNLDETAYRERLRRAGIGAIGRAWEVDVIGHRSVPVLDQVASVRGWMLDGLLRTVPEPEASLGAGILLGVRAGIDPSVRDAFAVAGLSHVVAISGWNVAIVVALIAAATRRLRERLGPRLPAALALSTVAAYVALVGASPAVVRAALMAAALLVARLGGSPAHAASALMAAVTVMLLLTPAALWDVGFQLSALATAGLIALAGPIESWLGRWPVVVRVPVALTLAAQAATLPVLLATFEQVSLVAPLANVLVVPLIPAVMAGAAAASLAGGMAQLAPLPVAGDVGTWLAGGAAWLPIRALIEVGTAAAALPLAALPLSGSPWLTAAWYLLLAVAVHRLGRRPPAAAPTLEPLGPAAPGGPILPEAAAFAPLLARVARPRVIALGLVVTVTVATVVTGPDGRLHLTVLDVGQGDAILVEAPGGATALIDGGPDPDRTLREIGRALPFHRRQIDVVLLTHPHLDHAGGLREVLRRHDVQLFVDGGRSPAADAHRTLLAAAVAEPGGRILAAVAGQRIRVGEAELEVLFPAPEDVTAPLPDDDVNNASVVVLVRYGAFEVLLTGDAEAPVEALLLERDQLGPIEILKVGHHGSDSSTTPAFVSATRPAVAVISLGADNSYGHPHRSTLDALALVPGIRVLRTDLDGRVEVVTDGRTFEVHGARGVIGPLPVTGTGPVGPAAGRIGR